MKSVSLILRIVAIVAAVAAAALFFMSKGKLAEKQKQLAVSEQTNATVQADLQKANSSVASLKTQLTAAKQRETSANKQLENTRAEMYTAKKEVTRKQSQIAQKDEQINSLTSERNSLSGQVDALKDEVTAARANASGTASSEEIDALNQRIATLEQSSQDLRSELSLAQSRLNSQKAAAEADEGYKFNNNPAAAFGRLSDPITVTQVDTQGGMLLLDLGDTNVNAGDTLLLVEDLEAVGHVKILSTDAGKALANILPGSEVELEAGTSVQFIRKS